VLTADQVESIKGDADLLGHSDMAFTFETYIGNSDAAVAKVAAIIEEQLQSAA